MANLLLQLGAQLLLLLELLDQRFVGALHELLLRGEALHFLVLTLCFLSGRQLLFQFVDLVSVFLDQGLVVQDLCGPSSVSSA